MGFAALLLSVVCWVTGTLYHRDHIRSGEIITNLAWQLLPASVPAAIIALLRGEFAQFTIADISVPAVSALLYLAIGSSILAFTAYTWLLTQTSSVVVSSYAYINPIIAVFLGWLVLGELVSANQVYAMLIILLGAFIINSHVAKLKRAASRGE